MVSKLSPSLECLVSGSMGFFLGVAAHASDEGTIWAQLDNPQYFIAPLYLGGLISGLCYSSKFSVVKFVRNTSACIAGYMAGSALVTEILELYIK